MGGLKETDTRPINVYYISKCHVLSITFIFIDNCFGMSVVNKRFIIHGIAYLSRLADNYFIVHWRHPVLNFLAFR